MPTPDRVVEWLCGLVIAAGLLDAFVDLPLAIPLNAVIAATILAVGIRLISFAHVMAWVRVVPVPVVGVYLVATGAAAAALWQTVPHTYRGVTVVAFVMYWLVASAFEYRYYDV